MRDGWERWYSLGEVCVTENESRGNGKQAVCCLVWKTKMGTEDKNVECTDWFFNTSFLLHQFWGLIRIILDGYTSSQMLYM